MKVRIRLFATLAAYLPAGAAGDGVTIEVPGGTTVGQVIRSLAVPDSLEFLSVVNGQDASSDQSLLDGDVLTLFPPLAGGS